MMMTMMSGKDNDYDEGGKGMNCGIYSLVKERRVIGDSEQESGFLMIKITAVKSLCCLEVVEESLEGFCVVTTSVTKECTSSLSFIDFEMI